MDLNLGGFEDIVFFVGGLAALVLGGQFLVRGALSLGHTIGVSPLFMGLVVVALGTSAPELFVAIQSVAAGQPDLAVGNIVGSNIANVLLVFGVGAMIFPIFIRKAMVLRDGLVMVIVTAAFIWIAQETSVFSTFQGIILTGSLVIYVLVTFALEQLSESHAGERVRDWAASYRYVLPLSILGIVVGTVALYFGSGLLVEGASQLARRFGVTEAVIGLSVLAIGTSLPELATTIAAAARRHGEVVVGNLLGSNIWNILAVMGVTSLFHEVTINSRISQLDMYIMLASAVVLIPFMVSSWRLSRTEGGLLVFAYLAYMVALYTGTGLR